MTAARKGPPGVLAGWVLLSRWRGEAEWTLVYTSIMTREEVSRRLREQKAGASAGRQYARARVILENEE